MLLDSKKTSALHTITQTSPENHLIAGQATDGGGIGRLSVFLIFADGRTQTTIIPIQPENSWHDTLPTGSYLWLTATDYAGNTRSVGALTRAVPAYHYWLPYI
jgi:hypothetical protein